MPYLSRQLSVLNLRSFCLLSSVFCLLAGSASARLGETRAQIADRFGPPALAADEPISVLSSNDATGYVTNNFMILVVYRAGRSAAETYSAEDPPLDDAAVQRLLAAQAGGSTWQKWADEKQPFADLYARRDGAARARFDRLNKTLQIGTREFWEAIAAANRDRLNNF